MAPPTARDPAPAGGTPILRDDEGIGTFAALRRRDFRLHLTGTTLSNAAQWIQQVTLGWLVYDLTGSGTALGTINLVRAAASIAATPLAGQTIDRSQRRPIVLGINIWLCAISLTLATLLLTDNAAIWMLFVFAFAGGAAQSFDMPLRQTITFDLVPRALAPNAVALIQTGWSLMRSLGPGLGGFLIRYLGPGGNFLIQSTSYVAIAAIALSIRYPVRPAQEGPRRGAFAGLGDGIRYVATRPSTRTFVMMGWVLPLLIIPTYSALPPIYAKTVFYGGPETLGLLMSAVGVGGIVGGIFTASLGRFERRGVLQLAALLGTSLSLIGFAFTSELWLALPLLSLSGAFEMVFLTTNQTLLQLSIPDGMRGRVTSIVSLNMAVSPLGSFVAGVGADLVGPRWVTVAQCGVAAAIAIVVFAFSSTIRDSRLSGTIAP
jgi:MFS family permease